VKQYNVRTDEASHALVFLRTTADTDGTLGRCLLSQEASGGCGRELGALDHVFRALTTEPLSRAACVRIEHLPRARRLLLQTLVYAAGALLEGARRGADAAASSFYSRGAFPALLWAQVITPREFVEWGEDYLQLQRTQIELASHGRDLGHCEFLLSTPYQPELEIESKLSSVGLYIKDYRAPRVLLIAGDRRSLDQLDGVAPPGGLDALSPTTPVSACNAAHLPVVDPEPQRRFLRGIAVRAPARSLVAQADASVISESASVEDVRAFILKSAIGPMRTFDAVESLASVAEEVIAVGSRKSMKALCADPHLQPYPIRHLPIGDVCNATQ
jgi:hypothetical protein